MESKNRKQELESTEGEGLAQLAGNFWNGELCAQVKQSPPSGGGSTDVRWMKKLFSATRKLAQLFFRKY